jgi:hypothetical protein
MNHVGFQMWESGNTISYFIEHIHTLQNLLSPITGIELEVKL